MQKLQIFRAHFVCKRKSQNKPMQNILHCPIPIRQILSRLYGRFEYPPRQVSNQHPLASLSVDVAVQMRFHLNTFRLCLSLYFRLCFRLCSACVSAYVSGCFRLCSTCVSVFFRLYFPLLFPPVFFPPVFPPVLSTYVSTTLSNCKHNPIMFTIFV